MNKLSFLQVTDEKLIEIVESLSIEIWNEHYTPIIGMPQVKYMLEKFQSQNAILNQIDNGYLYYLIEGNNEHIGYIGLELNKKHLFLSKIYIKALYRGKGYGKKAIQFVEKMAFKNKLNQIILTVNKNNINSITVYKKIGFSIVDSIIQDIGNGYFMDDYKMEKVL